MRILKPVISGYDGSDLENSDSGILLRSMGIEPCDEEVQKISPWRFSAAISPDMAAQVEKRCIDFETLVQFCQNNSGHDISSKKQIVLIEGVGGIMVPLNERHTVMDWMTALDVPTLVVAGSYLGAISHTLSTVEAMARNNLIPKAIVISESNENPVPLQLTAETISRFLPEIPVTTVPRVSLSKYAWKQTPDLRGLINIVGN